MQRRSLIGATLGGASLAALPLRSAYAQAFPSKPIRIIVPFTPGSATDTITRPIAERLGAALGQPVLIENRAGAGGTIGIGALAKAPSDGYTLGVVSTGHVVNPVLYANLSYDTIKDFAGVAPLASLPSVLVVSPSLGIRSARDLVAAAKAKPGSFNYATAGVGSGAHISAEKFRKAAGIDAVHVPFKGSPEAITETVAGRVDYFFAPLVSALPMIKAGKLTALAVGTTRRSALLPEVPTLAEAGIAKSEYLFWVGMLVSSKTPRDIVQKINQATQKAMQAPEVRERFAALGADALPMSAEQFDALIKEEMTANAEIIKAAGIKLE